MASKVDRGLGRPPAPGAGFNGSGSCAAMAAASPWESTSVSLRVAGSPMHIALSLPGLVCSQIDSLGMCLVQSAVAKSTGLHAPADVSNQQCPVKSVAESGSSRLKA